MVKSMTHKEYLRKQLDELDAAISKVQSGGQEVQINGRKIRRPDLSVLYEQRRVLQEDYSSLTGPSDSEHFPKVVRATWNTR